MPLKDVFIARILQFWSSGITILKEKLFYDKTMNLGGNTMQAVIVPHVPAISITRTGNASIYSGLELQVSQFYKLRNFKNSIYIV